MRLLEDYFNKDEKALISQRIQDAEKKTSGEIRVYFERKTGDLPPEERAVEIFSLLKMDKTELRNGVLFYIAFDDRKYAIIGDKGIHERVHAGFWEEISAVMRDNFARGEFITGLSHGIEEIGEQLRKYFPTAENDVNELPNEIAFKKDLRNEEE